MLKFGTRSYPDLALLALCKYSFPHFSSPFFFLFFFFSLSVPIRFVPSWARTIVAMRPRQILKSGMRCFFSFVCITVPMRLRQRAKLATRCFLHFYICNLFSCGHATLERGFVRPSVRRSVMIELESVKTRISAPAHPSATGGRLSGLVTVLFVVFWIAWETGEVQLVQLLSLNFLWPWTEECQCFQWLSHKTISKYKHSLIETSGNVQWNLIKTRTLGPWKLTRYIRYLIIFYGGDG